VKLWTLPAALLAALALALTACGDDDGEAAAAGKQLTVSAAASLKTAFEDYAAAFEEADVRYSFAGSDELAAQIRQGAKPDVYAAANTKLPRELFEDRKVQKPVEFAGNELVIAVPAGSDEIETIDDLGGEDVRLVIGDPDVPVGSYTREVLDRLPRKQRKQVLANVKSEEPDVAGIVGKLTQGAATAAFLYATDVEGAGGELDQVELPEKLTPKVVYGIAVVKGSEAEREANLFIDGLLASDGLLALRRAGFLPPPSADDTQPEQ
jgi:molybdate transport system substrate-binding protein